jgi:hypothetical protein
MPSADGNRDVGFPSAGDDRRRRSQGFTTTCNPSARVGTASRLIFGGFGFVKVPEAYVSVKESFSCEKKPPTRSDLLID